MQWDCPGWNRCGESYCRFCCEAQGRQVSIGGSMQERIYKVWCKILSKSFTQFIFFPDETILCLFLERKQSKFNGFHHFPLLCFRTIWKLDVPTSVTKSAPSFCSVYVIAKGKISSFRPATYADGNSKEDLKSDSPVEQLSGVKSVFLLHPYFLDV